MALLTVTNVSKQFGQFWALRDASFELNEGEILGILGPNGAGKTTLIHCILGLITPTSGKIETFGLDLAQHRTEILRQMNFASNYVSLPYSLTLLQNLMVYAYLYEIPEPKKRCLELLDLFELGNLKDAPSRRLSSGQMMRLSLAKAMLNWPKILLLDEPTAGLDPEMAEKTRQFFLEISAQKKISVIYTSHNLREMEAVSNRIIFLGAGQIKAIGTPTDLLAQYDVANLEEFFFKVMKP
jgi:ABC-2 type transport system ATP-binding protein